MQRWREYPVRRAGPVRAYGPVPGGVPGGPLVVDVRGLAVHRFVAARRLAPSRAVGGVHRRRPRLAGWRPRRRSAVPEGPASRALDVQDGYRRRLRRGTDRPVRGEVGNRLERATKLLCSFREWVLALFV